MIPVLFHLGPLAIHSYGVLFALSFAIGILLGIRRGEARGISAADTTDLALVILLGAIVGSRALYVIPHWSEFSGHPLGVLKVWEGGLTLFGGVILAAIGAWLFVKKKGLRWLSVADALAPSLALGLGLTRIGCFLNGCCYGKPTAGPLGVRFPSSSVASATFPGQAVLATQLIESAFGFFLFGALLLIEKRRPREGVPIRFLLLAYGLFRFTIDFFRYYEDAMQIRIGSFGALSVNQLVSLVAIGVGAWGLLSMRAAPRERAAPASAGEPGGA